MAALPLAILVGCTASEPPEPTVDESAATDLAQGYLHAVTSGDAGQVAALSVYPAPPSLDLVDARDLPAICVETEIATLVDAGVTASSSVELSSVGGTEVLIEGTDETVTYSIPLILFGLPNGDQVGRGILPLGGTDRVQIEPSEACDAALASAR